MYLYKNLNNSNILIGENSHWRTVKESLLTFMTSKKMIEKHYDKLTEMATIESSPFEKNLHEIYEIEKAELYDTYGGERVPNYLNSINEYDAVAIVFSPEEFLSDDLMKAYHYSILLHCFE